MQERTTERCSKRSGRGFGSPKKMLRSRSIEQAEASIALGRVIRTIFRIQARCRLRSRATCERAATRGCSSACVSRYKLVGSGTERRTGLCELFDQDADALAIRGDRGHVGVEAIEREIERLAPALVEHVREERPPLLAVVLQDLRNHGLACRPELFGQWRLEDQRVRLAAHDLDHPEQAIALLAGTRRDRYGLVELREEHGVVDRGEDRFLVRELAIEQGPGQTGLLRDVIERRLAVAVAEKAQLRRFEDLGAACGIAFGG